MRHAIIENESRKVVNIVEWEGKEWLPPRNHMVVPSDSADIGDQYIEEKKEFVKS